jgi:hypothetical protein
MRKIRREVPAAVVGEAMEGPLGVAVVKVAKVLELCTFGTVASRKKAAELPESACAELVSPARARWLARWTHRVLPMSRLV